MRKAIACAVVTVFAIGMSARTIAQDKPPAEHTMTGCLKKGTEAGTFMVENSTGKGPKVIGIVSSTANLTPHVGHKIDITGVNVPKPEAEAAKPKPPAADHYMKLSAIKMVSATCP